MAPAIALIVVLTATLTGIAIVVVRNAVQTAYSRGFRAGESRIETAWDDGAESARLWYESGKDPARFPTNPHRLPPIV